MGYVFRLVVVDAKCLMGVAVVNIVIVFHMGTNIENILGSPIGQPLAAICFNSFGTKPTVAVWSVIVAIQ